MPSSTEEHQVFLACKAIFSGPHAALRKRKTIQKRIEEHQASLQTLIPNYDIHRVTTLVRALLERGVFGSDMKAETEFPDLYVSYPERESKHNAVEHEAARSAAEALHDVVSGSEEGEIREVKEAPAPTVEKASGVDMVDKEVETGMRRNPVVSKSVDCDLVPTGMTPLPPLYPSYFPYHAQHFVLSTVQRVLEECFFDFARKWVPLEVERNGWDCAAAVELTKWTKLLTTWLPRLPQGSLRLEGVDLDTLLSTVSQIRHTAVHRLPTTARGLGAMILSAKTLAGALKDSLRVDKLGELYSDIQIKTKVMEMNKDALEGTLFCDLAAIQLQREELNRRERELMAQVAKSDQENKLLMGFLVEQSLRRIFKEDDVPCGDYSDFETADEGDHY
ncbi:hypothetical protein BDV25DRAFT_150482 [Aspergillus avenaceus]|uniref:Ubiquinol-cytochrome-c reductase cytochrome c1 n=1 Tax=Aspergillus avenaceus TaxID=36643 RepID=A0A5N6U2I8_ASPAV|nr:hypothetical protein BDV25DRAFT_150482 [Aspergillus avenaceus]